MSSLLLSLTFSVGCGSSVPAMVPVDGELTWKKKPLEFGTIWFIPKDKMCKAAQGEIQADGTFTLQIPFVGEGAQVGEYNIWIAHYKSQSPENVGKEIMDDKYLLPAKYLTPEESGLTARVTQKGSNHFSFTL